METVCYLVGDDEVRVELEGACTTGSDTVLLHADENLIERTPWHQKGWGIEPFLGMDEAAQIEAWAEAELARLIEEVGSRAGADFALKHYHRYLDDSQHRAICALSKDGWSVAEFPLPYQKVNDRISDVLGIEVSSRAGDVHQCVFNLRIVRPRKFQDNNPPHKDVYLDHLRNAVNIYVPICGSDQRSSLALIEGSHLLNEACVERSVEGARLNGVAYTVPCITAINGLPLSLSRPNPNAGEMLIFSPYLVHGAGYNFNTDETRVSLEARFWRRTRN